MADRIVTLRDEAGRIHRVEWNPDGELSVGDTRMRVGPAVDGSLVIDGAAHRHAWAAASGSVRWVFLDGEVFTFEIDQPSRRSAPRAAAQGPIEAPMPATVRRVAVSAGDRVRRGDVLIVLEAMKMELPLRATGDGQVEAVTCSEGDLVQGGQELVRIV